MVIPSLEGWPTKANEPLLSLRTPWDWPHWTPTQHFKVLGRNTGGYSFFFRTPLSTTTMSLTSFLRYCKDKEIINLLFWEFWECLTIPIKIIVYQFVEMETSMFTYLQKIQFLTDFFLKILERNGKPVILGNLGWETFYAYLRTKNQLHPSCFLWILQRYFKLVILGMLGMPGYTHPKWHYQLVENFHVHLQAKNQLHPPCFSGDIAKICKLLILGTLAMSAEIDTQTYTIDFWKTLMFICMPKIKSTTYFFLEILHFKESCNLSGCP